MIRFTSIRKRIFICAAALAAGLGGSLSYAVISEPVAAAADESVLYTGYISANDVNIRTAPTTSGSSVIACKSYGFQLDIYGIEPVSDNYAWYDVGFYLDGEYCRGYIATEFVTLNDSGGDGDGGYTEDMDFEEYINNQGFPESYKEDLRQLHAQYPKWTFVADHTGVDWNVLVENENVIGRSLVHKDSPDSWKSTSEGCYDWSTGQYHLFDGYWAQASNETIQYMLDPRNFINPTNIFMFESLSYNGGLQSVSGVNNIIAGTFMSGYGGYYDELVGSYADTLMSAGRQSGVSPYHLATRIIQELGSESPSDIISGNIGGYEGLYNYYNISATNGANSATVNGLIYASRYDDSTLRPWNTRQRAIAGGAIFLGSSYINKGQNTLYYQKFDIREFWHQYMTHIFAPRSESVTASAAYSNTIKDNTSLVFTIPVYDNMPEAVCQLPEENYGNVNNKLSSLSVDGFDLTPTFDLYHN
ncbi:MAG: hypothetical protein Q4F11_05810 [Eubacteriales bacterium]|nr:hypothetical protein [Eubacteriales bacterium]